LNRAERRERALKDKHLEQLEKRRQRSIERSAAIEDEVEIATEAPPAEESTKRNSRNLFSKVFYVAVVLLSAAFLFFGNMVFSPTDELPSEAADMFLYHATIREVLDRTEESFELSPGFYFEETALNFKAEITRGEKRGEMVTVQHTISDMVEVGEREPEVGDRVLIASAEHFDSYIFLELQRINYIIILAAIFFLLVVALGRMKGFNSIIALAFTCLAVFMVFIPSILAGFNVYLMAIVICTYAIASTFLIVIGPNKKSIAAMIGCLGGVLLAGLMMFFMDGIMHLTGLVEQESRSLLYLPLETPLDLRAILFAGVIIGATGAIMDVAMSISSALWEVRLAGKDTSFRSLMKSGIEIGKDVLGTMLNTLILAYIGSSMTIILLFYAHATSMTELMNQEMIIVEFLRALVGSFGMLFAIPLTAAICAWWFTKQRRNPQPLQTAD